MSKYEKVKRVTHQPSSITGGTINLKAGKGIRSIGSKISATGALDIESGGDVTFEATQDTIETETRTTPNQSKSFS